MAAGALRHRVVLETLAQTEGTSPAMTATYTELATVWAGIRTPRGTSKLEGEAVTDAPSHRFRMRYRSDVDLGVFMRWDGRRFQVLEVTNVDERKRWLEVLARELEEGV